MSKIYIDQTNNLAQDQAGELSPTSPRKKKIGRRKRSQAPAQAESNNVSEFVGRYNAQPTESSGADVFGVE